MATPTKVISSLKNSKYISWQFTTKSIIEWNNLYAIWYIDGIKQVPLNISDILTPTLFIFALHVSGIENKRGLV